MTGNSELFTFLASKEGGTVTFGDNNKGIIIGIGSIGNLDKPLIENVLLVKGLKHNLLSISQLCDKGYNVRFECDACIISDANDLVIFRGIRKNNVYELYLSELSSCDEHCLVACNDAQSLWHMRLGHLNFKYLSKLSKFNLVRGLPNISFKKTHVCDACQLGKLTKASFKSKNIVSTKRPLELLHLDLFGPTRIASINHSKYVFVIVDDYSRFTWVIFLKNKSDAFSEFVTLCNRLSNEFSSSIVKIRSDHGGEFENECFSDFYISHGILHEFAFPRAAPQNGVVERKNRTLQECGRTMLVVANIAKYFWAEAVNTACYVLNRVLVRPLLNKTSYELLYGRTPRIAYFKVFGCKCFLFNTRDNLDKFDAKSDEGIFLGYSSRSKAYRVFNKRTSSIEESLHVSFDESFDNIAPNATNDDDIMQQDSLTDLPTPLVDKKEEEEKEEDLEIILPKPLVEIKDHPHVQILGDVSKGVQTRSQLEYFANSAFISQLEPKKVDEAIIDEFWLLAMTEELNQFTRNDVWDLVPRPKNQNIICTRWIFRNKLDESSNVIRNKARLVAQG